jgi:predicted PurR-regulated permease PerM
VLLGIKYSFLLALFAGSFSLIPIFGTIISSVPIVVIALISSEDGSFSLVPPGLVLAWISGIHLLEANVLNPKIIGDTAHMHPGIVIFALLAGEQVYGLTGALLAVPVASMVQTIYLYALRRTTALRHDGMMGPSRTLIAQASQISGFLASDAPGDAPSEVRRDAGASAEVSAPGTTPVDD